MTAVERRGMSWLGEEERYPQGLTERCELLELLG